VHDRRIDRETFVFGNGGALFMNAMTWYDHKTESIWSQPWGRAIRGEFKGTQLFLLPSQLTTWGSWKAEHPETLAMTTGVGNLTFLSSARQGFNPNFVIGLVLADKSKAYYFADVALVGVVNDSLGDFPIAVWAKDDRFHAFIRQVDGRTLTFRAEGDTLVDEETGSTWDVARGLALDGPLKGRVLQSVPSSTSYDWAWRDFYPDSEFYAP
jgi:hypothetical protein